jgi:hypothetical protein
MLLVILYLSINNDSNNHIIASTLPPLPPSLKHSIDRGAAARAELDAITQRRHLNRMPPQSEFI